MSETNVNDFRDSLSQTALSPVKLTRAMLEAKICSANHQVLDGGRMTICLLTLASGFQVIGQSACMDLANYVREKGEKASFEDALSKIWELEAYHQAEVRAKAVAQLGQLQSLLSGMHGAEDYVVGYVIGMVNENETSKVAAPYFGPESGTGNTWTLDIDQAQVFPTEAEALESLEALQRAVQSSDSILGVRSVWRFNPRHFPGVQTQSDGSERTGTEFFAIAQTREQQPHAPLYFVKSDMVPGTPPLAAHSWSLDFNSAMRFPSYRTAQAFLQRHLSGEFGLAVVPLSLLPKP